MLRTIHKNRKLLLGILIIACVSLIMTGFGVDFFQGGDKDRPAIKINDIEISHQEFEQKRQQQLNSLQQRFGNDYWRLAQAIGLDINKQVADGIINETLLLEEAKRLGLEAGDSELMAEIEKLFPSGFSLDAYRQMLSQLEMNTQQFESELRKSLIIQTLNDLINDTSTASDLEAQALFEQEATTYDVQYVKIEAQNLKEQLPKPSDEKLSEFYQQKVLEYEQPAKVSYQYLPFEPAQFTSQVDVNEQDLELYYVDHQNEYSTPEQVKIKEIELLFSEHTGKDQSQLEELANQIIEEAKAGKDFVELIQKYSPTDQAKSKPSEEKWVERGKRSDDFDKIVFSQQEPGVAELIKLEQGYLIVKVEEYQPQKLLPLEDVREDITKQIQESLAPAYARDRAEATLLQLQAGEKTLEEVAEKQRVEMGSSAGLLPADQDPAGWRGLTKKVLEQKENKWQIIEMNDSTLLVEVKEAKESFIPTFAELGELREKLLDAYLKQQAEKAASTTADNLLKDLKNNPDKSLADAAKELNLTLQRKDGLKVADDMPEDLKDPQVKKAIFSTNKKGALLHSAIKVGGDYYIIQVVDIKKPSKEAAEQLDKYREMAQRRAAELILDATIKRLKAESEIDIDPALLTNSGR